MVSCKLKKKYNNAGITEYWYKEAFLHLILLLRKVTKNIIIGFNHKLSSLKGFPKEVGGKIEIKFNKILESLKGLEDIKSSEYITIQSNQQLTSLEYFPNTDFTLVNLSTRESYAITMYGRPFVEVERSEI